MNTPSRDSLHSETAAPRDPARRGSADHSPAGEQTLETAPAAPDYASLRRWVIAAGLLERSHFYYARLGLALALGLLAVGGLLALAPGIGDAVAVPALALIMMQIGLLAHDAGHNGIFRSTRLNRLVGLICMSALLGISFERWVNGHNTHHAHTNEVDGDPDIRHSVLAFTPEQAAERRGAMRWIVRNQARLFFLLAMGTTIGFRIDAWRHVLGQWRRSGARWELAMIVANLIGWLVLPSVLLEPGRWLLTFGASQLLLGVYMASVFAPNHKGMPLIRGPRPSFLVQQVITSRNVRGGPIVDFLYGGLNYQIEHHLFPNMARDKLPACRDLVRQFCAEVGLPHEERGVIASYRALLGELEAVGRGTKGGTLARDTLATAAER